MFAGLTNWMIWLTDQLYNFTVALNIGSYALAIILLTIIVKIVLYPLTHNQMKSMKKMQDIQPKVKEIQAKYKGNPEKMNQKVMQLYKESGASPLSGCLPLLVQLPIFIVLYQSLLKFPYQNLEHADFFWIQNLSQTDPFYVLPILAGASTYLQSRTSTTNPNDKTQRTMMILMPLFLAWISSTLPAGVSIYWITFSLVSTIQQLFINKRIAAVPDAEPVKEVANLESKGTRKNRKNNR